MRILYHGVSVKKGQAEVIMAPSREKPGVLKMLTSITAEAVKVVQLSYLSSRKRMHLYMCMVSGTKTIPPGLYADKDTDRLTWVVVPREDLFEEFAFSERTALACVRGGHFIEFADPGVPPKKVSVCPIPLDVVTAGSPHWARCLSDMLTRNIRVVPGLVRHESGYGPSGNKVESWGRPGKNHRKRDMMVSSSIGISHIFLSNSQMKNYREAILLPSLKPSFIKRIEDSSKVIRNPIDTRSIDFAVDGIRRVGDRSVGSFSRPTDEKGVPESLRILNKMAVLGRIDRMAVTWVPDTDYADVADVPPGDVTLDFTKKSSRDNFLRKAASVSAAIFNSKTESSPVAILEAAYCGASVLHPECEWSLSMPSGLPFRYKSTSEIPAMLEQVFSAPEKYSSLHRDYVVKHYGQALAAEYVDFCSSVSKSASRFASMSDKDFSDWSKGSRFIENIGRFISGKKSVKMQDLYVEVGLPRSSWGHPMISHHDLPVIMRRAFGWEDDCLSTYPVFVKG